MFTIEIQKYLPYGLRLKVLIYIHSKRYEKLIVKSRL
jgi:hypothetical protein